METKIKKLLDLLPLVEKLIIELISIIGWVHLLIVVINSL